MTATIFFTHIMKTGGISVTEAITDVVGEENVYPSGPGGGMKLAQKSVTDYLLSQTAQERQRFRFITVHQPAWVAFEAVATATRVTVLRDPVSRTISHLRQISSHELGPPSVEAAWADPGIRARLTNYMCQIFADPGNRDAPTPDVLEEVGEAERKALFEKAMTDGWSTAIWNPLPIDATQAANAVKVLGRYDVVGVTEDLSGFTRRLESVSGLSLGQPSHLNRTTNRPTVDPALVDEIRRDTQHDQALYDYARSLA